MNSQALPESPAQAAPATREGGYRAAVARVAHGVARALEERVIGPGDAAELRRLKPDDPASPAFWRMLAQYIAPNFERLSQEDERRWAVILNALATLAGLDTPGIALGAALRDAGFSELRFVRLLRAEDERLADTVRGAARYLASKAQPANLAQFADLVLSDGRRNAEQVRRDVARTYYQPTIND